MHSFRLFHTHLQYHELNVPIVYEILKFVQYQLDFQVYVPNVPWKILNSGFRFHQKLFQAQWPYLPMHLTYLQGPQINPFWRELTTNERKIILQLYNEIMKTTTWCFEIFYSNKYSFNLFHSYSSIQCLDLIQEKKKNHSTILHTKFGIYAVFWVKWCLILYVLTAVSVPVN